MEYYVIFILQENVKIWKNLFARKNPYEIKKIIDQIIFYLNFAFRSENFVEIDWFLITWDIANLWFCDNFQNFKIRFIKNMGQMKKMSSTKSFYVLILQ